MTEAELAHSIEVSKQTVLRAIGRYLPAGAGAQVEDVAQETYLRYFLAFRNKQPLTGDDLQKWLFVAARNESYKTGRKTRREWFALFRRGEIFSAETAELPEEGVEDLRLQIAGIPEPFREAVQLRSNGLKISEIAARLGVSPGTVKSRLSRGKEWLARVQGQKHKRRSHEQGKRQSA
jgi:RNA polymerase sigma factor (sigma-70 family)